VFIWEEEEKKTDTSPAEPSQMKERRKLVLSFLQGELLGKKILIRRP